MYALLCKPDMYEFRHLTVSTVEQSYRYNIGSPNQANHYHEFLYLCWYNKSICTNSTIYLYIFLQQYFFLAFITFYSFFYYMPWFLLKNTDYYCILNRYNKLHNIYCPPRTNHLYFVVTLAVFSENVSFSTMVSRMGTLQK